jgi:hypothetical protein
MKATRAMKKSEQITKGRPFKFRRTRESKKCKKPINLERKADKRERERERERENPPLWIDCACLGCSAMERKRRRMREM